MKLLTIFIAVAFAGCSVEPNKDAQPEQNNDPVAEELDNDLPEMTVLRVALDENGNEIAGKTELRTVQSADLGLEAAGMANQFDNAATPSSLSELDEDSSSQQFWFFTKTGKRAVETQNNDFQAQQNGFQQQNPGVQAQRNGYQQQQNGYQHQQSPRTKGECINCGTEVKHVQGARRVQYPTKRKVVYQHNHTDVRPREHVDVYPVETVRVHPTQRTVRYHPVQRRVEYANPCVRTGCGNARYSNYWPSVQHRGYQQYYYYSHHRDYRGYRYYSYCKPRVWFNRARFGWYR